MGAGDTEVNTIWSHKSFKFSGAVVLMLERTSESPGKFVQTQIVGPNP